MTTPPTPNPNADTPENAGAGSVQEINANAVPRMNVNIDSPLRL